MTGDRPADVRSQMNRLRPKGFDALTTWNISWRFQYQQTQARCAIASVKTTVKIVYTLPKLDTHNPDVRKSFDAYMGKLRLHEDGHARNGADIARRIDAGIATLAASTCGDLERNANALGNGILKEGNAFDVDYDTRTDHGRTQGARWP